MAVLTKTLLVVSAYIVVLLQKVHGQCLNEVAAYNPNLRTMTGNDTFFLVPVKRTAVQAALDASYGKTLTGQSNVQTVTLPSNNKAYFPKGFPADKHLVLVGAGLSADIRMAQAQINGPLLGGQIIIPFVRHYNSAPSTVLQANLNSYLAGPGNNQVAGLIPSTVSTIVEGFATRLGQFSPDSAAWQINANNVLSNKVAWAVAPNQVSGPGVYIEAADSEYLSGKLSYTTLALFKYVLNQPAILSSAVGQVNATSCQRNQIYFNNDTSIMYPRVGNVTLGPAADGIAPQTTGTLQQASSDGSGVFTFIDGFSACGQNVGYNPEPCDQAAKNVDRSAL